VSIATTDTPRQATAGSNNAIKSLILRCVISRSREEGFIAECIDLDIVVRGQTEFEAQQKMMDAIKGYLRVVSSGDSKGLLPRPAPLSRRVRYHLLTAVAVIISTARRSFRLMELSSECACRS
jgi:hypothetical protein